MRLLLLLTLALLASAGTWAATGRLAAIDAEAARQALLEREQRLLAARAQLVPADEFRRLTEECAQLEQALVQRRALLDAGPADAEIPPLAEALAAARLPSLYPTGPLGERLQRQAGTSARAERLLALLVMRLGAFDGLSISTIDLGEGQSAPLGGDTGLEQLEAVLVLSGGLPDVLSALETLVPARGAGLPQLSVRNASLRRIEPERWGPGLHQFSGPPVRLSVTLAAVFASETEALDG